METINIYTSTLKNIAFITIATIIIAAIVNPLLFKEDLGTWLIVIGGGLISGTFFSFVISSMNISESLLSAILGIILIIIGGFTTSYEVVNDPPEIMGRCPDTVWRLTITYNDDIGCSDYEQYCITGDTKTSDIKKNKIIKTWEKDNPLRSITRISKIIIFLPKEYVEANGYNPEYYKQHY